MIRKIWNHSNNQNQLFYYQQIAGDELPSDCYYPSMVTSPDGFGVILVGCLFGEDLKADDKIYELRPDVNGELTWKVMSQKLKYARGATIAMLIPDDITNCD